MDLRRVSYRVPRANGPRIAAIGGGNGLSTMLRGLKNYTENLTAIVTVADDGVGFDVSSATGAGMGYRIINMLVQNNLGSQLDVRSGPEGTRVTFGFHLR